MLSNRGLDLSAMRCTCICDVQAFSLGFQSSVSKAWYLEEVLASVHHRLLLRRCFRGFVLPVLEYCSAV